MSRGLRRTRSSSRLLGSLGMKNAADSNSESPNPTLSPNTLTNTHRTCAERRLIDQLERAARRHGVHQRDLVSWIRRKYGHHIVISRERADGTLGCSWPCAKCAARLIEYDLVVHAMTPSGTWFVGKLTDPSAPPSDLVTFADSHNF